MAANDSPSKKSTSSPGGWRNMRSAKCWPNSRRRPVSSTRSTCWGSPCGVDDARVDRPADSCAAGNDPRAAARLLRRRFGADVQATGLPVERGPRDLRRLPEFFGQSPLPADYGRHDIQIVAEINHCPRLKLADILAEAATPGRRRRRFDRRRLRSRRTLARRWRDGARLARSGPSGVDRQPRSARDRTGGPRRRGVGALGQCDESPRRARLGMRSGRRAGCSRQYAGP